MQFWMVRRVDSVGRLGLPKKLLRQWQCKPNQPFEFGFDDEWIYLTPIEEESIGKKGGGRRRKKGAPG